MHRTFTAAACLLACTTAASAQDWPTRPVTMVVPFAAGGAADVLGRLMLPQLSELLGQPVVLENVGGAGGMMGASRVAKAPPDGYQFILGGAGSHAINQTLYKNPLYNAATDFQPVALLFEQPLVLTVRNDLPAGNLHEFIAYAKANQAKMQYGSGGTGSTPHLACALLNSTIGINVTHVPYRGTGPVVQDMLAGRIDYMCPLTASAAGQIAGHEIKPIAMLSKGRSASLPNLASADEQGLTGFDASTWNGFFLPKGTPAAIVKKLHDAASAAVDTPALRQRLTKIGVEVVAPERRTPDYLQTYVEKEIAKWAVPIKANAITAQ